MSLRPREMAPVPEETARIAHAAFPKGNMFMRLRDELGAIYQDERFAALYPKRGQPAQTPWRLALVLVMQFAEGLSDRQAAEAVRSRIDWKYALALELTDPGFDSTVLSELRTRLVQGSAEQAMLDALLDTCREKKWLAGRGRQRTDSTHVLGAIRALNRLECVGEAIRHALNSLAVAAPDWLREQIQPEWKDRYGPRVEDYRLPKSQPDRQAHAELIGADGYALLDRIYAVNAPSWLRQVPAIETLRRIWLQQYYRTETQTCWRTEQEGLPPSARFLNSSYDPDAHYAKKRGTSWVGYKVHLTETCDDDRPHLITHGETTAAPTADSDAMEPIHGALAATDLLPSVHLVDTGYVDAKLLVSSRGEHDVDLLGPARVDDHWQAQEAKGFAASCLAIDWERQQAICPAGRASASWTPARDHRGHPVLKIKFSSADCGGCPHRPDCTRSGRARRMLTVQPPEQYAALQAARQRQETAEFAKQYSKRAGIEGTLSQAVRTFGLRRARYLGQAKTHLQHILIAASLNVTRIGLWWAGEPRAQTRKSRFLVLVQSQAA